MNPSPSFLSSGSLHHSWDDMALLPLLGGWGEFHISGWMPWMLRTVLSFSLTTKSLIIDHKLFRCRGPVFFISLSLVSNIVLATVTT